MSDPATNTTRNFKNSIKENFPFELTVEQNDLLTYLGDFMSSDVVNCFILRGYAGTGKSTIVSALSKSLKLANIDTVLMAPTGRAAKVISNYSQKPAFTIHKKIYIRRLNPSGYSEFVLAPNIHAKTLFIVDEASMIADESLGKGAFSKTSLLSDLLSYVRNGHACKLLLVGDTAQLPPVGLDESPALDERVIAAYGFECLRFELTEVVRQAQESGILQNATYIRSNINQEEVVIPKLHDNGHDVIRVGGYDLQDELESAIGQNGVRNVVVITRSNKRALLFNQQIRSRVFWYEELLVEGELLMIVKNNYFWSKSKEVSFIANGDLVEVVRINKYIPRFGLTFADVTLSFVDYPGNPEIDALVLVDTLEEPHASIPRERLKELWNNILLDYQDEKNLGKRRKKAMEDPFMNALLIKYAYSITCHKAQGGQWPVVFIDHGYLTEEMMGNSFLRWLYTGVTRAQEKLYLLNFHPLFLEEET